MAELQSSSNDRSARAAIERSGLSQKHRKLGRVVEVGMGRRKDLVSLSGSKDHEWDFHIARYSPTDGLL